MARYMCLRREEARNFGNLPSRTRQARHRFFDTELMPEVIESRWKKCVRIINTTKNCWKMVKGYRMIRARYRKKKETAESKDTIKTEGEIYGSSVGELLG